MKKRYFSSLIIVCALALTGCSTPAPNHYLLPSQYIPTSTTSSFELENTLRIGVVTVSMPTYLKRPQIVLMDVDNMQLEILEQNRWAEPLEDGITRLVSELLHQKLSQNNISVLPLRVGLPVDITIQLDIRNFEGTLNGQVTLSCTWTLLKKEGAQTLKLSGDFSEQLPAGQTLDELIQNQSKLLDSLTLELVNVINETLL